MNPTEQLYQALEVAYDFFNSHLFNSSLPKVIFTVQRQKGVMGYFAPDRWGTLAGDSCHEIAINPSYIAQSRTIEVLQTLGHEMVHCWQFCHGDPGRRFYHNKEWAKKMIEIGLMPSSTGEPGGNITGQNMSDYMLEDGRFYQVCNRLLSQENYRLNWVDRKALPRLFPPVIVKSKDAVFTENILNSFVTTAPIEIDQLQSEASAVEVTIENIDTHTLLTESTFSDLMPLGFVTQEESKKPSRYRYVCPSCNIKIYGKPQLKVRCELCDERFVWSTYDP